MTREEKETIFNDMNGTAIQPEEPMNLEEIKAYVKGFEDARNAYLTLLINVIVI